MKGQKKNSIKLDFALVVFVSVTFNDHGHITIDLTLILGYSRIWNQVIVIESSPSVAEDFSEIHRKRSLVAEQSGALSEVEVSKRTMNGA